MEVLLRRRMCADNILLRRTLHKEHIHGSSASQKDVRRQYPPYGGYYIGYPVRAHLMIDSYMIFPLGKLQQVIL